MPPWMAALITRHLLNLIYRKFKNSYLGTLRPKSGIVGQAR